MVKNFLLLGLVVGLLSLTVAPAAAQIRCDWNCQNQWRLLEERQQERRDNFQQWRQEQQDRTWQQEHDRQEGINNALQWLQRQDRRHNDDE